MELIRNLREDEDDDDQIIGEVYFSLFERYIRINFEKQIPRDYVDKCVHHLNSLGKDIIDQICSFSLEFCNEKMEIKGKDDLKELSEPKDILKYIEPVSLIVDEPENLGIPAINLYCKCAWEKEHDMQILIKGNQLVYVGVYDGLDPWQDNLSEWGNYVTGYR